MVLSPSPGMIWCCSNLPLYMRTFSSIRTFANLLIAYAIVIIAWGAFVRISGSGDGCGQHWPLCHGTLIMSDSVTAELKTWIEFAHRAKSGLFGILVIFLWISIWRLPTASPTLRRAGLATVILTGIEGFLGAQLVLQGWVGDDVSLGRALMSAAHFGNTLLLLGVLTLVSLHATPHPPRYLGQTLELRTASWLGVLAVCLLGCSGAWAALGSTLLPSDSLLGGLQSDLAETVPFAVRVRILHPVLGLALAALVANLALRLYHLRKDSPAKVFLTLSILQPFVGVVTLLVLSPTGMKLAHLIGADLLWISMIWGLHIQGSDKTRETVPLHDPLL
jgi:heme a synthase